MRIESRARARALQALYACEMRGGANLDRVAAQVWDDLSVTPEERRLAGLLVHEVASGGAELDSRLADVTTNWRLERLGAIERSVLRLGAAELMKGETPPRDRKPCGWMRDSARRRARSSSTECSTLSLDRPA